MNETERITLQSELPAGRELDALVAEKVMGWLRIERRGEVVSSRLGNIAFSTAVMVGIDPKTGEEDVIPYYTASISAAWEVVERLLPRGKVEMTIYEDGSARVNVYLSRLPYATPDGTAAEDTVPLAICRAALATVR